MHRDAKYLPEVTQLGLPKPLPQNLSPLVNHLNTSREGRGRAPWDAESWLPGFSAEFNQETAASVPL